MRHPRGPRWRVLASALASACLALASSAALGAEDPAGLTADQILDRVSREYRNLGCLRSLEDVLVTPGPSMAGSISAPLKVALSECDPGQLRISTNFYDVVSNARETWVYLRSGNEYLQIPAAPLLQERWGDCPKRMSPVWTFGIDHYLYSCMDLEAFKPSAKLEGEAALKVGAKTIDCYIVELDNSVVSDGLRSVGWRKLWVDKATFLVWKDESSDLVSADPLDQPLGYRVVTFEQIDRGTAPGSVFQFAVPTGATRVDSFGQRQSWLQDDVFARDCFHIKRFRIGDPAPELALTDLGGRQFKLSDSRGRIVVLEFWASWCQPCQEELAAIQRMHDELASKGVVFLGIDDESPETVKSFATGQGYNFPMLLDMDQTAHELYDIRWVPITVVIDRKGKIAARYVGAGGEAQLRRALKSAGLNTTP
ncbi:MAG: redoxin domain-containing protein [Terriglobia bacterium]